MVPVGPAAGPTEGRGKGRCLLTGSAGSGKPAAWLGFCLGGYLRVFSRVCQPWPPPCFHKCPLQKELVVLGHGADAISTGEVPPWRPGCRRAEQRQGPDVPGTATSPVHAQGEKSPAPSRAQQDAATRGTWKPGDVSWTGGLEHPVLQALGPHTSWETTWLETEDQTQSQATHMSPKSVCLLQGC